MLNGERIPIGASNRAHTEPAIAVIPALRLGEPDFRSLTRRSTRKLSISSSLVGLAGAPRLSPEPVLFRFAAGLRPALRCCISSSCEIPRNYTGRKRGPLYNFQQQPSLPVVDVDCAFGANTGQLVDAPVVDSDFKVDREAPEGKQSRISGTRSAASFTQTLRGLYLGANGVVVLPRHADQDSRLLGTPIVRSSELLRLHGLKFS